MLGTGVELRRGESGGHTVEAQVFVETEDGETLRGTVMERELELADLATQELLQLAEDARDTHLGELRRELPDGISQFDFYAAPFRIDLADEELRAKLAR